MSLSKNYSLPIRTDLLTKGKEHPATSLKQSLADFIHLILTTSLGECKFHPELGCSVWENDFDIVVSANLLKDKMQNAIRDAIEQNEKRLTNVRVDIKLSQEEIVSEGRGLRIKRKLDIKANGIVVKTNEPFEYFEKVYIGPISYS
ncbi:MAG: GPW/gp25 family protein [Chitinophagales bacterium]|nr:GPW/gp25 family protein [Chitinophagales bacterium]